MKLHGLGWKFGAVRACGLAVVDRCELASNSERFMLYDPRFYALVHRGNPGDVEMYVRLCAGSARVLELGSGYGRVSLALAEAGHEVWGVDLHPGLMALAEQRVAESPAAVAERVHLVLGDMRAPKVTGTFDRVIIPFSGVYCLEREADVLACFRAARALLADDGLLVFDAYAADNFHHECMPEDYPDEQLEPVALIAVDGVAYDVFEKSTWDRDAQRVVASYVHVPDGQAASSGIEHHIAQRYLLAEQVEPLLQTSGFTLRSLWGDFDEAPYDHESEFMVVVASPARA